MMLMSNHQVYVFTCGVPVLLEGSPYLKTTLSKIPLSLSLLNLFKYDLLQPFVLFVILCQRLKQKERKS